MNATTISPADNPVQRPATPHPREKHRKYPEGRPRAQCATRFASIGSPRVTRASQNTCGSDLYAIEDLEHSSGAAIASTSALRVKMLTMTRRMPNSTSAEEEHSQMKLQMKREALSRLHRYARDSAATKAFDTEDSE